MRKVLILVNHDIVIFCLRLELVQRLVKEGYSVTIACPRGERVDEFAALGCEYREIVLSRHGTNPLHELKLFSDYKKLLLELAPDVVLTFSIKPNVYGGVACARLKIPYLANVTGLGDAIKNKSLVHYITKPLYRLGLKGARTTFFQNPDNLKYMQENRIFSGNYRLLPGSGVNLERFSYEAYPPAGDETVFLVIGRITKDKGTDEILEAARILKERGHQIKIRLIGFFDGDYREQVEAAAKDGIIEYCGQQNDVHDFIKDCHAVLHASYHEGMANAVLEGAATGRPILATRIPGCIEGFDEGVSGIGFEPKDVSSLCDAIERFLALPHKARETMGKAGREKMEREFDRSKVVDVYLKEIEAICK